MRAESYNHVRDLLIELCPAPNPIASWRTDSIVMHNMTMLAAQEAADRTPAESTAIVSDLVDTCVAMLEAPISTTTTESLGATS